MFKIKFLVLILAFLSLNYQVFAELQLSPNTGRVYFIVNKRATIVAVARKFFPYHKTDYAGNFNDYVTDLIKINPQIKDLNNIPQHAKVYVDPLVTELAANTSKMIDVTPEVEIDVPSELEIVFEPPKMIGTPPAIVVEEKKDERKFYLTTKKKESLNSVAQKFFPSHKTEYGNKIEEYIVELQKINPDIKNWKKIPKNTKIFIDPPLKPKIVETPKAPQEEVKTPEKPVEAVHIAPDPSPYANLPKLFAMYTASQGSYTETTKVAAEGQWESSQNSPVSLGLGTNYVFANRPFMLTGSAYWSYITSSKLTGDTLGAPTTANAKPEIGVNVYFQHYIRPYAFSLYGGFDYENFSTVNTKHFVQGEDFAMLNNSLIYATAGFGKSAFIFNRNVLFKLGFSQSISSTSTGPSAADKFSGQRLIFFSSVRATEELSFHMLYKRHMLVGPTTLTIDRIGLGFAYDIL
jgi:hypothetical protein